MDGPSLALRQADDRSEGTAQRREDRPVGGTTSLLIHKAISESPSLAVRQPDKRSEDTAQRREDRPTGRTTSLLELRAAMKPPSSGTTRG
ncbi:hypothetical protein [Pantoea coffeiphila]|uniref:hypothetical protein n=1 Tax=Pantoea coffeiphila TaxID=1465635 RepID=UPI0011B08D97|nr:hypothetical protein [Pantoea coffeiphila]